MKPLRAGREPADHLLVVPRWGRRSVVPIYRCDEMTKTGFEKPRKPSTKPTSEECEKTIPQSLVDEAIAAQNRIKGIHSACAALPLIGQASFDEMCKLITKHGRVEAVVIDSDGMLLDGRSRLAACHKVGREVDIEESTDNALGIAESNLARRHLNVGQRAVVGRKLLKAERVAAQARKTAGLKNGTKSSERRNSGARGSAVDIVAKKTGVSPDSLRKVEKLPDDLQAEVLSGKRTLHGASKVAAAREGKEIPKKPKRKSAKPPQATPDCDGIAKEYEGYGITVYVHRDSEVAAVVIQRRDGKWLVQAPDLEKGKVFGSEELAESLVREHLLSAAMPSEQAKPPKRAKSSKQAK